MRKTGILILGMGLIAALAVSNVLAQTPTVDQVVARANLAAYYAGNDGMSDVKMTITDAQGRSRSREFRIMRFDVQDGGMQKFYVYFYKPTDVAQMVYMVWKNIGKDDDRWLYLPAMDLVSRVAASDKRSSFVGSHFVYEDVSGRGIQADAHEIVEETDASYELKNIPLDKTGVEFAYYYVWVRKPDFLPVKSEYYNVKDELIRSIEALEVQDIQGHPTVVKSVVKDFDRGGQTEMNFSNVRYDAGLDEGLFEERYLRRPAMNWLK